MAIKSAVLRAPLFLALAALAFVASAGAVRAGDEEHYVNFDTERPMGEVKPDKALLYVVRPNNSMGFAVKSFFLCDDEILGINKGDSYFFAYVDPGTHVFWSKSENVDALELEVEAGTTYYIQQHVRMGGFRVRTKLEVVDEAEGKALLAKCGKHATMTEKGNEKGKEIAAEHKADTKEDLERRAKEKDAAKDDAGKK